MFNNIIKVIILVLCNFNNIIINYIQKIGLLILINKNMLL